MDEIVAAVIGAMDAFRPDLAGSRTPGELLHIRLHVRSLLSWLDTAGYAVVPLEPTPEMSEAAYQIEAAGHSQRTLCEAAYRAMIEARPR